MTSVKVTGIAIDGEGAAPESAGAPSRTTVPKPATVKTAKVRIPIAGRPQIEPDLFFNASPESRNPFRSHKIHAMCTSGGPADGGLACVNLGNLNVGWEPLQYQL